MLCVCVLGGGVGRRVGGLRLPVVVCLHAYLCVGEVEGIKGQIKYH